MDGNKATHKLKGESPRLNRVTDDPEILQVAQCLLIDIVAKVDGDLRHVHEGDRPELGDRLQGRAALLEVRLKQLQVVELCG